MLEFEEGLDAARLASVFLLSCTLEAHLSGFGLEAEILAADVAQIDIVRPDRARAFPGINEHALEGGKAVDGQQADQSHRPDHRLALDLHGKRQQLREQQHRQDYRVLVPREKIHVIKSFRAAA